MWNEVFSTFVVGNEPIRRILFHHFIGCAVDTKFSFMGINTSLKIHAFMIQPSGTGKSFSVKLTYDIMKRLGIRDVHFSNIMTEASLSGTIVSTGGCFVGVMGLLGKKKSITFDEGSMLLKGNLSANITDMLQTAMDEPGIVSKGLRGGIIEYEPKASILASSYFTDIITETALTKGFLQRMLLSVTEKEPDRKEMISKISASFNQELLNRMEEALKEISKIKQVLIPESLNNYITTYHNELYDTLILNQYEDKREEILKTFFNRSTLYIMKLAVQNAIINKRDILLPEDIDSTREIIMNHLKSICRLLDYITIKKQSCFTTKDRLEMMLYILQQHGNSCSRTHMLEGFKSLREQGIWNLAYNRTLMFMDDAIGSIITDEGKNYIIESDYIGQVGGGKERLFHAREL